MKKGFTLIELLAVIVILAIIAVIAVPIVLNIIDETKDNANKRSIDMYAKAVENAVASYKLNGNSLSGSFTTTDGKKVVSKSDSNIKLNVEYDGSKVVCETFEINEDGSFYIADCTVNGDAVEYTYGEQPVGGGGAPAAPVELTTLTPITWKGVPGFVGLDIWTDGTNTYLSFDEGENYILNGDTWEEKVLNDTNVRRYETKQYVLNGDVWEKIPPTVNLGGSTWTDGKHVYRSVIPSYEYPNGEQYILNGDTWSRTNLNGAPLYIYSEGFWTDGTNYYYSMGTEHYTVNGNTWERKVWNGLTEFSGNMVWSDGTNAYYSNNAEQYILRGDTWEPKTWEGDFVPFQTPLVWTDGTNYYYSMGPWQQYIFS